MRRYISLVVLLLATAVPLFAGGRAETEEPPQNAGGQTEPQMEARTFDEGEALQFSTPAEYEEATGNRIAAYAQAPVLDGAGLPPVADRLPAEPAVVQPVEEIGQYGGTWERVFLGPSDTSNMGRINAESVVRWSTEANRIVPNILKGWQELDNGRVFIFELREGLRWSDGAPFTADDLLFWYEDVVSNPDLGSFPSWFAIDGERGTMEKVDEYTVRIAFPQPYGYFIRILAYRGDGMIYPKHYLSQFHADYADADDLAAAVADAGFDEWFQLFDDREDPWTNPERPTLGPWVPRQDRSATRLIMERNPYFWKVDVEGNQLPYIDRIAFNLVESDDVATLRAIAGDLDMQFRHISTSDFSLLMNSRDEGDYRVLSWTAANGADPMILPNLDNRDPVLRELLRDARFRRALSVAIDRDEINQIVYQGLGVPRQATVIEQSIYYLPEFGTAYAQFDPDLANELLDEIGLTERDGNGYRLRADGQTLSLTIDVPGGVFGPWEDVSGLVAEYWNEVGIRASLNIIDRSLMVSRSRTDEFEIGVWNMDSAVDFLLRARYWIPQSSVTFAPLMYAYSRSGGENGNRPTELIQRLIDLYDESLAAATAERRMEIAHEMLRIHADQLFVIGTVGMVPQIGVVRNNFRNVPENAVSDYTLDTPGNTQPSQFFIRQ